MKTASITSDSWKYKNKTRSHICGQLSSFVFLQQIENKSSSSKLEQTLQAFPTSTSMHIANQLTTWWMLAGFSILSKCILQMLEKHRLCEAVRRLALYLYLSDFLSLPELSIRNAGSTFSSLVPTDTNCSR